MQRISRVLKADSSRSMSVSDCMRRQETRLNVKVWGCTNEEAQAIMNIYERHTTQACAQGLFLCVKGVPSLGTYLALCTVKAYG